MTSIDDRFAAVRSLMMMIDEMIDGALLVDKDARIVWSSDRHIWFEPQQGNVSRRRTLAEAVGQPVESVLPHSRMREVVTNGRSIPLDIMKFGGHTLLISRLPLRGDKGEVIGAIAFAMKNSLGHLRPIANRLNALESRLAQAEQALAAHRSAKYTVENLIGFSPAMLQVKRLVRKASQVPSAVLLLGETGTGKELVAHSIHAGSNRAERPFVGLNVAAIPETLLEAEFFGVAPGAYTGAGRQLRPGKFQLAQGGTLFLDEIGDMPATLQAKLLRALQEQEIEPVGSNQVIRTDVRIIAATSRPLAEMVRAGTFRADLFYRLNVLPIALPPLRDRPEDLEILASVFSERMAASLDQPIRDLSPAALELLRGYDWPGNVRELANVMEQLYVRTDGDAIIPADFTDILPADIVPPAPLSSAPLPPPTSQTLTGQTLTDAVDALEKSMILRALHDARGNKQEAARVLGLSRTNLYAKLRKYRIALDQG